MIVNFVKPSLKGEKSLQSQLQHLLAPRAEQTELVTLHCEDGTKQWLLIERGRQPKEGDWMVLATPQGWRARRYVHGSPLPDALWGVLTWVLRRPS